MRPTRLNALLLKLAVASTVLLALNTILLVVLLVETYGTCHRESQAQQPDSTVASSSGPASGSASRLSTPTSSQQSPTPAPLPATGGTPLAAFFNATVEPLSNAAGEFGTDPSTVLPTDEQLEAAIASGSIDSAPSKAVLEKLKAGYALFNMPFPEPRISASKASTPSQPSGSEQEQQEAPSADFNEQQDILRAFFSITTARLERVAAQRETQVSPPDAALVQEAIASGSTQSEASQAVLEQLRDAYSKLGIPFPEPDLGP